MTATDHMARQRALQATLATLADFHSQPSLALLETQLSGTRALLHPMLWILAIVRRSRIALTLILCLALVSTQRRWFADARQPLYVVSLTPNNDRVLNQLGAVLRETGLPFKINRRAMPIGHRLKLVMQCAALARVLRAEGDSRSFVFLHQILGAIYTILFDADLARLQPDMVIAANDHSPPTVALFALARTRNLRSCYVQHGPVTSSFPPLSTDLAVLFCAKAEEDYRAAAQARGYKSETKILIFPAMMDPCVMQRSPTPPLRVCIALSFFADLEQVANLLTQLHAQENVDDIVISQHPRSTQDLKQFTQAQRVRLLPVPTTAKEIAAQVDLCIVGNSGVAVEFLHYGCPTFYLGPSETALDDYYGFVQAGILPRFTPHVVENPTSACAFFTEEWRNTMSHFDPLFANNPATLKQAVVDRFETFLQTDTSG